jgi:hypothetical protein
MEIPNDNTANVIGGIEMRTLESLHFNPGM